MRRCHFILLGLAFVSSAAPAFAAAMVKWEINPGSGDPGVGATATLSLTVTNGKVSAPVRLPATPGLRVDGSGTNPQRDYDQLNFFVTPLHEGDYTIRAFDIRTDDGETLHVGPINFHARPIH